MPIKQLFEKISNRNVYRRTISDILETVSIPSYRHSLPRIKSEFYRVRRFQHPLSVVAIGMNGFHSKNNLTKFKSIPSRMRKLLSFLNQSELNRDGKIAICGPIFLDSLREIDIISYDWNHNQFLIFLPETDKKNALTMIDRVTKNFPENINEYLTFGIAEFPTDGYTVKEIVQRAMNNFIKHWQCDQSKNDSLN